MQQEFDVLVGDDNYRLREEDKHCEEPEETVLVCLKRHPDTAGSSMNYVNLLIENRRLVDEINAGKSNTSGEAQEEYFQHDHSIEQQRQSDNSGNAVQVERRSKVLEPLSTNLVATGRPKDTTSQVAGQKRKADIALDSDSPGRRQSIEDFTVKYERIDRTLKLAKTLFKKTTKAIPHDKPWEGIAPLRRPESTTEWYSPRTTTEMWAKAKDKDKTVLSHIGYIHETDAGEKHNRRCDGCGPSRFHWEDRKKEVECWAYKDTAVGVYTTAHSNKWLACARCRIRGRECSFTREMDSKHTEEAKKQLGYTKSWERVEFQKGQEQQASR